MRASCTVIRISSLPLFLRALNDSVVSPSVSSPISQPSNRVLSLDTLRGLTILLMVFVNDAGQYAPYWMHHIHPSNADGMTPADIVFPTFLFIAGASIPLAVEAARKKGQSTARIIFHILTRTAALLLLGVIYGNAEADQSLRFPSWEASHDAPLWGLLAFIAVICAWASVPKQPSHRRTALVAIKVCGVVGLIALLAIYRRKPSGAEVPFLGHVDDWIWLKAGWWEILGLIGWTYFSVSLLYLLIGQRREWMMGAVGVLLMLRIARKLGGLMARVDKKTWLAPAAGLIHKLADAVDWLGQYLSLDVMFGSLAAVAMAGCLLGSILTAKSDVQTHRDRLKWAFGYAALLLTVGLVTDCVAGINKNADTPAWCMFCSAIACTVWALLYLLMDVYNIRRWSIIVAPAGANPLIAYLMHPILGWTTFIGLGWLQSYQDSHEVWANALGSAAMALAVCAVTALVAKAGLRMRI